MLSSVMADPVGAGNVLLFSHAIRLASCIGTTSDARDVDVDDGARRIQCRPLEFIWTRYKDSSAEQH